MVCERGRRTHNTDRDRDSLGGLLTAGAHVDEGVVDQDQLVEVELVGEALAFGLVQNPLVVVVPVA